MISLKRKNLSLLALCMFLFTPHAKADIFLATHLLLNSAAVKFLPNYTSTTAHGAYMSGTYGYRFEQGDSFKTGSHTQGSEKSSPGFGLGYQLLHSDSHKLALDYHRTVAQYQGANDEQGEDIIDSFGIRFNFGLLAFKLGWSGHKFNSDDDNQHDGGTYTGVGFDLYFKRFSVYMDLTNYYLEDRKKHIAGGDIGFRYHFGSTTSAL